MKTWIAGLGLALALAPLAAHAQFFIEGTVGKAEADLREFRDQDFSTDSTDNAWSLGVGYMFNRFIGFEAGYRDLGESGISTTAGASTTLFAGHAFTATGPATLRAATTGWYFGPLFETYIGRFDLTARIGMYAWESDLTTTGAATYAVQKQDGIDPYVGLAAAYRLTPNASAGVSWTRFKVLDDIAIDAWDLRLKFSF